MKNSMMQLIFKEENESGWWLIEISDSKSEEKEEIRWKEKMKEKANWWGKEN